MDNDKFPTDINYMQENFKKFNINYKVLGIEEEIEIWLKERKIIWKKWL